MDTPLVTFGVPVYRGHDVLPVTLECIQAQTYENLEVLISVDGNDRDSARACEPFLADTRFRLHVQPSRLGWAGNIGWTMRNRRGEFYLYQQHDDQVSPTYVADLVSAAMRWPNAAICYSEMAVTGLRTAVVRDRPVLGHPIARALTHLERLDTAMFRGLMRGRMLDLTGGMRVNDFDSFGSEHALLIELALLGEFRFVEGPTYFKRIHGENLSWKWSTWPLDRKRGAWASLAVWVIEVLVPAGRSVEERRHLFQTIIERFLHAPGLLNWVRLRSQWLQTLRRPLVGGAVRTIADLLRVGGWLDAWVKARSRTILFGVDVNDPGTRDELARAIFQGLRASEVLHPNVVLGASWDEIETMTARRK